MSEKQEKIKRNAAYILECNVADRMTFLELIPKTGNLQEITLNKELREKIALSDEEKFRIGFKEIPGQNGTTYLKWGNPSTKEFSVCPKCSEVFTFDTNGNMKNSKSNNERKVEDDILVAIEFTKSEIMMLQGVINEKSDKKELYESSVSSYWKIMKLELLNC